MVPLSNINSKSQYNSNRLILLDDFNKIFDSDDPEVVSENFSDLYPTSRQRKHHGFSEQKRSQTEKAADAEKPWPER